MAWTTQSKEKQKALASDENTLTSKIKKLAPSCDFDLLDFYQNNKGLVKKYIRKNTLKLVIDDFDEDDIPDNWWYKNKEGVLKAKIKGKSEKFTTYQKLEWIKCGLDVVYFTRKHIKIISIDDGIVPFDLYDYQEDLLYMYGENRFSISLQARQSGKCVTDNTLINIRNKTTGELKSITIEEFHELRKKENNS